MRFGTYEASYDNLPRMLSNVVQRNPGSAYDIFLVPGLHGGPHVLKRAFFCLGACVRAFQYCLPMLCIDGTFLTEKYKGQILSAIGVDCNNQVVPIAFAFVENENTDSWYWFLERVKTHVVAARPNMCLISDRNSGLLAAIKILQEGNGIAQPIWPDVQNKWCIRHMGANFHEHFKNRELMQMFKRLCIQNQQRKFNALWQVVDNMTAEQAKARASGSNQGRSEDGTRPAVKPFSHWIRDAPKEKWSLLYDTNGSRYNIQTTNHAECYNMVMRNVRGFPLVGIVEFIMYGCVKYFRERYMAASLSMSNPQIEFCTRVTEYMDKKTSKAKLHRVQSMGTHEQRFHVACKDRRGRGVHRRRVVQECLFRPDGGVHCSCMKPLLLDLRCSHVIAACGECGLQPRSFVSPYFSKESALNTWWQEIHGVGILGPFTEENNPKMYEPDPATKKGPGRRQHRRIRNAMDESEAGKTKKRCNLCGAEGHSYKRCPTMSSQDSAEARPLENPTDGAAPPFEPASASRARPRRSISSRPRND